MSIENIRSSLNALENLARNLGLDPQELSQRRDALSESGGEPGAQHDSVTLTSNTLRRLQMNLSNEEPITWEQAQTTLQGVQNASSDGLLQAHGGLDPQRVFALLGMDE